LGFVAASFEPYGPRSIQVAAGLPERRAPILLEQTPDWAKCISSGHSQINRNQESRASWTGIELKGTGNNSKVEPKRSGIGSQTTIWMSAMVDKTSSRGKIQERYGIQKDQAKKDIETWFKSLP
jgi:hypothetical protein